MLELNISIKLLIEAGSGPSHRWRKKSFVKSFIWSVGLLYIQPTFTLVDFE